jgi:hypothetical protein
MKKLFLILIVLFVSKVSFGQAKVTAQPDIFFTETTHDFGSVTDAAPVKWEFTFFNPGKAPLLLKNVKASFGCTTPVWPRQPIMPGDSAKIVTEFNPKGFAGQTFNKSITVTTNISEGGQDKIVLLFIKGNVKGQAQ